MGYVELDAVHTYVGTGGAHAPIIYLIDSPDHPFDVAPLAQGRTCTIVTVPVASWNEALTPWPAAGLYREEPDFGGKAASTLDELLRIAIPAIEQQAGLSPTHRALGGYSLGGLFSLYAFTHCEAFAACACLSGSVWYEGWVDHLHELDLALDGRFAYLSLGTKEKRGARPIMRTVQDNMGACAEILRSRGCDVRFELGPGNHLQHIPERYDAGLTALDEFLGPSSK